VATGPLVSPGRLAVELARPGAPVVLDCRWSLAGGPDRAGYEQGHLPGAVFVDLDRELSAPPDQATGRGGRHPLPDPAVFQAAMRRAGVGAGRAVVAYDQGEPGGAARAWWLLGWFGHPGARVLDGGLPAWVAAGLPVVTEVPDPDPGDFTTRPGPPGDHPGGPPDPPGERVLLDADGAARLAASGVLLDARAPARYQGLEEPVDPVAGHIPGAVSLPLADLLTDRGLVPPATVRQRLAAAGAGEGTPVGAYCGSGVVAAHLALALEAAGVPAALYAGSWSDWVADPSRPVATGSRP
jgi:thiosulfate/3-mercaptopyruvate sulfurtransferase